MNISSNTSNANVRKNVGTDLYRYPNLRVHREQRGLSQAKLSVQANVSKDLISSAERSNPHRRMKLFAIIHALNEHEHTKTYGIIDPQQELVKA